MSPLRPDGDARPEHASPTLQAQAAKRSAVHSGADADAGLWRLILAPGAVPSADTDVEGLAAATGRLVELIGPALARHMLAPSEARLRVALVDPERAGTARRLNRLAAASQVRWARVVADAGIGFVCMKGFASARTLYPDPDLRTTGDLDLLVRAADRDRLVTLLAGHGFRFATGGLKRWGFISDASYAPFVSPDGLCNIDIHVRPDSWPAHLSLTTERVFAAARTVSVRDGDWPVPAPEHAFALCIANAAKDKFGPFVALKLVDAARIAAGTPALDWGEVAALARTGRFLKPARVFISLLAALGVPPVLLPAALNVTPRGPAKRAFDGLVADWRAVRPERAGPAAILRREFLLCTEPGVGLHNAGLRLRGLVRPASGVPGTG